MATIHTKYDPGDVVYFGTYAHRSVTRQCPDCLGTHEVQVITPAGVGYIASCPRCGIHGKGALSCDHFEPVVHALTIRQATVDRNTWGKPGEPELIVRYYFEPTRDFGSGTMIDERELYETEEGARFRAEMLTFGAAINGIARTLMSKHGDERIKVPWYTMGRLMVHEEREKRWQAEHRFDDVLDEMKEEVVYETADHLRNWAVSKLRENDYDVD